MTSHNKAFSRASPPFAVPEGAPQCAARPRLRCHSPLLLMPKRKTPPSAKLTVLITDKLAQKGVELLKSSDHIEVIEKYGLDTTGLHAAVVEADALIVRSGTKVTAAVFEAAAKGKGLKAVGRAGTGVDNIDLKAATSAGCIVMNAPGGNALAAAEHTCALLFAMARHIAQANASLRADTWARKQFMGVELAGKTLGIAGLGRIGREVAKRALACRMNLVGYDPYLPDHAFAQNSVTKCETLDELFAQSDFITLHMPLTPETKNMINTESIGIMKKGVRIINCARGGLIEPKALLEGLKSGQVGGAGLDVFEEEPPKDPTSRAIIEHPTVVSTPHLGASTVEAQDRCGVEIAGKVAEFLKSGTMQDSVNFPSIPRDEFKKMRPVLQLAENLGRFAAAIADGSPQKLCVTCFGDIGSSFRQPITISAVKGVISAHTDAGVCELVNAMSMAEQRGLQVEDSHSTEKTSFAGLVRVRLTTEKGEWVFAGTVLGNQNPRLVELDGVTIDCELKVGSVMLVNRNRDVPGVVGKLGSVLGNHGINIMGLQLGQEKAEGEFAVSIVVADRMPSESVMMEVAAIPDVLRCKAILL